MSNQPPTMTSSQASDSDSAPQPVHSLPWMKTCPLVEVSACRGFSCGSLPSVISFALEISTEIVRNNDAMTAHSQMTVTAHSEAVTASGLRYKHTRRGDACIGEPPIPHVHEAAFPTGQPASDRRCRHSYGIPPPRHVPGLGGRCDVHGC